MPKDKEEVEVKNFSTKEIRPIRNWCKWLQCWEKADNFQYMESLLHVGFNVPLWQDQYGEKKYDRIDRDIFYFTIANDWGGENYTNQPPAYEEKYIVGFEWDQSHIRKTEGELRQQLALKAFNMLCQNLFKVELQRGDRRDRFSGIWEETVVSERLFPVIQNFFRVDETSFGSEYARIRNLSARHIKRSHNEELAVKFLLNLADFLWTWSVGDSPYRKEEENKRLSEMRVRIENAKPWMIEVLVNLDRFDLLRKSILKLDEPCLAKLEEIALRNIISGYHGGDYRDVISIEEACYVGSKVGWFLKEHELMKKEHKRLVEIREAEVVADRARRKIKQLTSK